MPDSGQLWIELVGDIIVARIRGQPNEYLLAECQRRVLALAADSGCRRVLYDALELDRPPIEIVLTQQSYGAALQESGLKVAIVVPNTAIAYLSRLAFGRLDHRVFYNDMAAALAWLTGR